MFLKKKMLWNIEDLRGEQMKGKKYPKAQAQQKICVKYFIICKPKGFINAILGYWK